MNVMRLIIALVGLFGPIAADSQALRVSVRDGLGKPIASAMVWLLGDSAATATAPGLLTRATDDSGAVVFDQVPTAARRVRVARFGYGPVILPLGEPGRFPDHVDIVLRRMGEAHAHEDSIAAAQHRARVAIARARERRWRCTLGRKIAHSRANAAFGMFVSTVEKGMRRFPEEYGMPTDSLAFVRAFTTPLIAVACRRFAEGMDQRGGGLETDTIEVYRFGKAFYLPWYGDAGGGFADAHGRVLTVFIVPD